MQGYIRIIAGKWRGLRLPVLNSPNLRPTPDRVRETLFNWLSMKLPDANCLDLFAGTGALGFEALSRGAKRVVMVDAAQPVVLHLKAMSERLATKDVYIYCAKVPEELEKSDQPFDIVFLDPPYQADLLFKTCEFLEKNHYLADLAYLYLEANKLITDNELPKGWRIIKQAKAGQVFYHLIERELSHT